MLKVDHDERTESEKRNEKAFLYNHQELVPLIERYKSSFGNWPHPISNSEEALEFYNDLNLKTFELSEKVSTSEALHNARLITCYHSKLKYLGTLSKESLLLSEKSPSQHKTELEVHRELEKMNSCTEKVIRIARILEISTTDENWHQVLRYSEQALPLAEPTELLLTRGCDDRTTLNPHSRINKYYTSTIPRPGVISRSSCTCSYVTLDAFKLADQLKVEMLKVVLGDNAKSIDEEFSKRMESVRCRISSALGIKDDLKSSGADIILTPSGTDAEMLVTSAASARVMQLYGNPNKGIVYSFMTASGEVGSGSSIASSGRYFSTETPSGNHVRTHEYIQGFDKTTVTVMEFAARSSDGLYSPGDIQVEERMRSIFNDKSIVNPVVLLHVVIGSKTGALSLRFSTIERLRCKYGNRVIVVVDACQMRLASGCLSTCIRRGYNVLITGSKFFAGAAFSGGILMAKDCLQEIESALKLSAYSSSVFPPGYLNFFCKTEFPPSMKETRAKASDKRNVGLWLRWETALRNMEAYYRIPSTSVKEATQLYMESLKQLIISEGNGNKHPPTFILIKESVPVLEEEEKTLAVANTIASFQVFSEKLDRKLSYQELKHLHQALATDFTFAEDDSCKLSRQPVVLGQPVMLGTSDSEAVIRIALSAEMVVNMCLLKTHVKTGANGTERIEYEVSDNISVSQQIQRFLDEDRKVLCKIKAILKQ